MKSAQENVTNTRVSFLQLFRLIFVLFSLYLLWNIFHRWDGFKFYATFAEYIPSVALVFVLWTLVASLTAILAWMLFRSFDSLCDRIGLGIRTEHVLLFGTVSLVLGVLVWEIKKYFWVDVQTSIQMKLIILMSVVLVSAYLVWIFRNRASCWFQIVQERITPLIWLFGTIVVISVPIIGYYTLGKDSHKPVPKTIAQSSASESDKKRPNILLVSFDTLTARDMSLYGYNRETTPFIAKWAENATVFTKLEAETNFTTPAAASMMTGKHIWTHQVFQLDGSLPVRSDTESLPYLLKKNGYYNVAFIVNRHASTKVLGIFDSFDISPLANEFYKLEHLDFLDYTRFGTVGAFLYRVFGEKIRLYDWILDSRLLGKLQPFISPKHISINPDYSKTPVPPELAFNKFLEIIDDLPEPFFAWIHVFPPHNHYLPPEPYRGIFGPNLPAERYRALMMGEGSNSKDMSDLRILYDEFTRYCDKQYEEFIIQLEKRDKMKNTTVILTSDHGESFQHEVFGHNFIELYEQVTHVPLVIKEPAQSNGKVIDDLVEQIDIPATILDLADITVPSWMEGRSFVPLMRDEKLLPRPAYSMFFGTNPSLGHGITKGSVAVWEGDYKLIRYLKEEKSLLFNLKQDPEELDNLAGKEPEITKHLLDLINTNLERANKNIMDSNH